MDLTPARLTTRDSGLATTRIVPAVLLVIFAGQCLWFVGTQSFTIDEPTNLWIGVQHWRGHLEVENDNPPLLRLLCSLPLLRSPAADVAATNFETEQPFDPIAMAWRTRPMNVVLGLLLGVALWRAARRRFSAGAANFALALFAFSAPLIAHFSIVGTDGIAALMIFVTALQVAAFRRDPSWGQALVTGVVLGLLLLAKLYTIPMFALALLLVTVPSPAHFRLRQWNWGKALVMIVISFVMLWGCYWFTVSKLVARDHHIWLEHHGVQTVHHAVPVNLNLSMPVPAPDYLRGISFQLRHGREGHQAYLLGQVSDHGWRYYFPVAVALKWPTVVLVLAVVTGVLVIPLPTLAKIGPGWGTHVRLPRDFGVIFLFPISFFALAIFSTVNIGERYVLAVYPFVLLLVAGLYPRSPCPDEPNRLAWGTPHGALLPAGEGARRSDVFAQVEGSPGEAPGPTNDDDQIPRTGLEINPHPVPPKEGGTRVGQPVWLMVLLLAVVLNAADVLRYAPDYLSYFTVFVSPQQSWRYLSDSSTDWGQGLIALRKYERQHPGEQLHVAYWSNGIGPDTYGVEAVPFGEKERPTGTVIVSPGALSGQYNDEQEAYRWVLRYPVKAVVGHDFLVFEVPR